MSWKLANAVLQKQIGKEKLFTIAIALHCFQDSPTCHPGMPRLAELCEISESAAYRKLKKVKSKGYVTVQRRQHLPALLTLHPDKMPDLRPATGDRSENSRPATDANPDLSLVPLRPVTGAKRNKEEKVLERLEARGNAAFTRPSLDEVRKYCLERGNNVDPERFIAYYKARGWKLKGVPMEDWQACIETWETNNYGGEQKRKLSQQEILERELRLAKTYRA